MPEMVHRRCEWPTVDSWCIDVDNYLKITGQTRLILSRDLLE